MNEGLHDLTVLLTRQSNKQDPLQEKIHALGGKTRQLPLFAVQSLLTERLIADLKQKLPACNLLICISRNAAKLILPHVAVDMPLTWAAIGPGTGAYLQQHGVKRVLFPTTSPFDSTALMTVLLDNINIKNQYIIVLTGADGDSWLQSALLQHGGKVFVAAIYKRTMPQLKPAQFIEVFNSKPEIDIILITCVTSLVNLIDLASTNALDVQSMPLLVISQRIYARARELGFTNVHVANGMATDEIIQALKNYRYTVNAEKNQSTS